MNREQAQLLAHSIIDKRRERPMYYNANHDAETLARYVLGLAANNTKGNK